MGQNFLSVVLFGSLGLTVQAGTEMKTAAPPVDTKRMTQVLADPPSDAGFYVAVLGGAQFATNYGDNKQVIDDGIGGARNITTVTIHSNWGGTGGLKAGYNFNSFPVCERLRLSLQPAVEAEALYIGDNSHDADQSGNGSTVKFSSNSGDFFLNGILRFKNPSRVTPYLGIGAGLQYITTHGTGTIAPGGLVGSEYFASGLNTSDLDFAGQALCGFDIAVCPHVVLFTEYKFIDAIGNDGKQTILPINGGAGTYRLKPDQIQQNLITAGVKYEF